MVRQIFLYSFLQFSKIVYIFVISKRYHFYEKQRSTAANELSRQWAVRPSTAHRLEIRRALYLTTFDKNDVLIGEKQRSTAAC